MSHNKEVSYKKGDVVYVKKDSFGEGVPSLDKAMIVEYSTSWCYSRPFEQNTYVVGCWVGDIFDESPKMLTCNESLVYRM